MGQLVLGAVGAVAGFYLGGPEGAEIGFMAGSMIGGIIFAPKHQAPQLNDVHVVGSSPEELEDFREANIAKWRKLIKDANIKADQ